MTITELYPYLIIVGSSILLAAGWLLYQYRTQLQRTAELIKLNEELAYDLPDFLRQCWQVLGKSGFSGLYWQLDWFGTRMEGSHGERSPRAIEKSFEVHEIRLHLNLYHRRHGLEKRYFSTAQADNFFLLVRMNLWIKLGTVQGAFEQAAKINVFLKHDVKNMVQLLRLSSEQLLQAEAARPQLLESLQIAIPAVLERAEHMLRALNEQPGQSRLVERDLAEVHELPAILQQSAALHDLELELELDPEETGRVRVGREALVNIVDNLLTNYSRQARQAKGQGPLLHIHVYRVANTVHTLIRDIHGKPFPWPERLFEPFWSEYGNGRGIGLYQARQQAAAAGGKLEAHADAEQALVFSLSLPSATSPEQQFVK